MKIGIVGNYGATNIGDDAILTAILYELENLKIKKDQVTVFSAQPEMTRELFGTRVAPLFPLGFRSFFKYGFRQSLTALKKIDVVILGGGGLFQDNYLYACFLWTWQIFWVWLFKKPLFIHSAGVGPLKTKIGRWLTRWSMHQANTITVRDEFSLELLIKIGVKKEIHLTADPVFLLRKADGYGGKTRPRESGVFIISLRPWLHHTKNIIDTFLSFLRELKETRGAEFIFVSMQQIKEHDLQMIEPLASQLGGKIYLPHYFSDLLGIMETAEFAIGMRYHFMIAALLTRTPLLPISYSPKTDMLFEGSELKEYVSQASEISEERLKMDLKKLSANYNNVMVNEKALLGRYVEKAETGRQLLSAFIKKFDPTMP